MNRRYQISDPAKGYVRTNLRTVQQRAALLREFLPRVRSVAEICCGDCHNQWQAYNEELGLERFLGLDLQPAVVALNKSRGIPCLCGDAMDRATLGRFVDFDVLFYGPPLSLGCHGHELFSLRDVVPAYDEFARLLLGELGYDGTLICICPKTTSMGDIQKLYAQIKAANHRYGVPLIHYSRSDLTGDGTPTEVRLKYVEVWFSAALPDQWEIRGKAAS